MITDLMVDSFEGIKHFQEAIKENVILTAGANGAGKSSLRDAIHMALFNSATRVKLKKHWPQLIHDGAKRAIVEASHPYGKSRAEIYKIGTNRHEGDEPPRSLVYTAGGLSFARLDVDHQRSLILEWAKVDMSSDQIKNRLLARHAKPELVELIEPFLKSSFEVAQTEAKDRAKLAKISWRAITGESYGEIKAESWQSPKVAYEPSRVAEIRSKIIDLAAEINPLATAIEQAEADTKQRSRYSQRIETLTKLSKDYQQRSGLVALAAKERNEAQERVDQLRIELNRAQSVGETPPMQCPCCDEMLVLFMGRLVKADSLQPDPVKAASLAEELHQAEEDLKLMNSTLKGREKEAQDAVRATQELAILEDSLPPPPNNKQVQKKRLRWAALNDERVTLEQELEQLLNAEKVNEKANEETRRAHDAHQMAQEWTAIADLLAPDGIPSDFLAEALRPFNSFLVKMQEAGLSGLVQISNDMTITYNGREFGLLCESEQWRAEAQIAAAIGCVTGNKFVLLDRMDVLEPKERGTVLNLAKWLGQQGFQVWLFATLKQKPGAIEGIQTFWLSHGTVLR